MLELGFRQAKQMRDKSGGLLQQAAAVAQLSVSVMLNQT